ncbi:endonuclease I [Rhizobium phage RHph_I20]|uniref:Endonuclease I n=1 Tax=Rhizobium phage RHph_I20 TaxID=2509730 RepID=A0A7S5RK22_9CAUD|nr:endonuclease I [Rhizobium phage RHph_I20]
MAEFRPIRPDGFRSGLEATTASFLNGAGVPFEYETRKVYYLVPRRRASYTPDFVLPNGIILETKGIFDAEDRQKHLLIKDQHPDLDIRFVFSRSASTLTKVMKIVDGQKIRRENPTTYASWCQTHGFMFADKVPPIDWLTAPPNPKSIAALAAAASKMDFDP